MTHKKRGLVLGGGGFAASSWITGLIAGLAEGGVEVRDADLLIGTSSGGRVALQLASGKPLEEVYEQQLGAGRHFPAARPVGPGGSGPNFSSLRQDVARAKELGGTREEILQRYGALALSMGGQDRREMVARQLPMQQWPERAVRLIALNAKTGERRAFDRASGIELVDALMATTAAFGSAPVTFEGQAYIDGGYYSSDNADLAAECGRVLVLALKAPPWALRLVSLEEGIADLKAAGVEVDLIQPDEEAMEAITAAGSPMDPAIFEPVTRAGRAQGLREAARRP